MQIVEYFSNVKKNRVYQQYIYYKKFNYFRPWS